MSSEHADSRQSVEQLAPKIDRLPEIVDSLTEPKREIFSRHFSVIAGVGKLGPSSFPVGGLQSQTIIRIRNRQTDEASIFNAERAKRPQQFGTLEELVREIQQVEGTDALCQWQEKTPASPFGRIFGKSCFTASALYKTSELHDIQIFLKHDPLCIPSEEEFLDRLDVADNWFWAAHKWALYEGKEAIYPVYFQNQLGPAGASIRQHGHAQLILNAEEHLVQVEKLFKIWGDCHKEGRDYFEDLFLAYQAVGLGLDEAGIRILPSLTPKKEKEIQLIVQNFDEEARRIVYKVYRYYLEELGVKAFDFTINYKSLIKNPDLEGFPAVIISLIDRGDPTAKNSDIGALELQNSTAVVSSDPYLLDQGLKALFNK